MFCFLCYFCSFFDCSSVCVLTPPQAAVSEVVELERIKTPEPKQWISLGSELEIEEETVKETRDKVLRQIQQNRRYRCVFNLNSLSIMCGFVQLQLQYRFSRVRRKFGAPVCFSDRNTADAKDGHLECAAYPDSRFSIKQLQRDCGIQAVPTLQSSTAQTQWYVWRSGSCLQTRK